MTDTIPTLGAMAAGLVTAASSGIVPVEKVVAAVEGTADTLMEHNPQLEPVVEGAEHTLSQLAEEHGEGVVWSILETLFPLLARWHHAAPVIPTATGAQSAG